MMKRWLKGIIIGCFIFGVLYFIADLFSPGSYHGAILYEIKASENQVISNINIIKSSKDSLGYLKELGLHDGRARKTDYWYHFFIYFQNEEKILNCWVRSKTNSITTLALVSIREPTGKWKVFGRDFTKEEEKLEIKEFENKFLNELKKMVNSEGN